MYWATITFRSDGSSDLKDALREWSDHIRDAHPKIREVRCYQFNAGTSVVWQEGFDDFHDYQELIEQEDDECELVMSKVFVHAIPGTRAGQIWTDGI